MSDEIPDPRKETLDRRAEQKRAEAADMLNCYARLFCGSDDGLKVLADLRKKFGVHRLSFVPPQAFIEGNKITFSQYDPIAAALRDGERRVMSEIEDAILRATNPKPKPNP